MAMRHRPLRLTTQVGRFHIGYDEEKTLTGLVDDWDRYQREIPINPAWCWRAQGPKCGHCRI